MALSINGLDYLRSKTQVDLDSLDIEGSINFRPTFILSYANVSAAKNAARGSPYTDATSNQVIYPPHPSIGLC